MTHVGSLPFTVVDTKAEAFLIFQGKNHHQAGFPFFACRARPRLYRSSAAYGAAGKECFGISLGLQRLPAGCSKPRLRGIERLGAAARGPMKGEDGGELSEDALQATIEKSKKVLAMQRELLQQISERRKLISSLKSSITDQEDLAEEKQGQDEISFGEDNIASSNIDHALANDQNAVGDQNGSMVSSSFVHSTTENLMEIPSTAGDLDEVGEGIGESSDLGRHSFDVHPSTELNNISSETFHNDALPSSPSAKDVNSLQYETHEDFKEQALPKIKTSAFDVDPSEKLKDSSPERVQTDALLSIFNAKGSVTLSNEELEEPGVPLSESKEPAVEDVKPPPLAGVNVMNVIIVAAECAPWSKTGGLGDVAGALPKGLARRGHRVMVVVPKYDNYTEPQETGVRKTYKVDGQDMEVTYFHAYIDGVDFVFMESPMFRHRQNDIYGGNRVDILKRMVLFCKAAVEVPWYVPCGGVCYGDGNLVFIANDWHTALLPVYLKACYRDNGLMTYTRSVLVIHNIAHQGRGPLDDFAYLGLPPHYLDLFRLYDPVGGEHLNIFAAGIKTAERVVTVSHGYAWELKTPEGGWGLHGIINENDWKLRGIVNGIDNKEWNPQFDVHLKSDGYTNYNLESLHTGKHQCKAALQKELGLPVREDVPLIGFIGRLDHQKGVDLIAAAVPWLIGQNVQLVMLGTGRLDLEQMLRQFASQHNDKVRGWVGFSIRMAHRITAGADILLMPSRFEPCGLNQLYAMKYGTVPVVHAVGGLRDTVQPFDPFNESGLGWTFDSAETNKLVHAMGNCLLTYREYKKSWEGLQRRGMMQGLSWDHAAQNYEEVLVAAKFQW